MPIILSLDLGTSKLCALALDVERLTPLAVCSKANDADVPGLPPGHHEQHPGRIRDLALELIEELLADAAVRREEIRGLGISGQMHGVLLVDRGLQPAGNLITWRDQRVLDPGQPGSLVEALAAIGTSATRRTGCRLHAGYGGVTLYHLMRNGGIPKDCTAVTIADYLAASLCGVVATEPTDAASWGLLNLRFGRWDEEIVGRLGLPGKVLPEVRPTARPLGPLCPDRARSLGLPEDAVVCAPMGDNQASIVGVAGLGSDAAVVNLGTGGQVSIPQPEAVWVEDFETRPMPFGGHVLVGASLCGGWSYAYLRHFFQEVVRQFAGVDVCDQEVYRRMNRLAAEADAGAGGLSVDTRFSGTREDPGLRGAVCSIGTQNLTAGNLARAFAQGMVRELADLFHRAAHPGVKRVIAGGNGVRENPLVVEAIESLFGRKCRTSIHPEEAVLGAAYAAAIGTGLVRPSAISPKT